MQRSRIMRVMDAVATQQLAVIERVHDLLSEASIGHWLFGGWGVDFLVGNITRPHGDIDFVIWRQDIERIRELFSPLGYRERSSDDATFRADFDTDAGLLSMVYIERDARGDIVTPDGFACSPWAEDSFEHEGSLEGVRLPVISALEQMLSKEAYFGEATGTPLRPKDEHDVALLRGLLDSASR